MQESKNKQNSDFWEQDLGKEGSKYIWHTGTHEGLVCNVCAHCIHYGYNSAAVPSCSV